MIFIVINIIMTEIKAVSNISTLWPGSSSTDSDLITFKWSQMPLDCRIIHYKILASNCGNCPSTTTSTAVTCIGAQTDGGVCRFAVQTVVCGDSSKSNVTIISDKILVNLSLGEFPVHVIVTSTSTFVATTKFDAIGSKLGVIIASAIAGFFAVLFVVSTIVFVSVIVLQRKMKIQDALTYELAKDTRLSIQDMVTLPEDIDATENIAYDRVILGYNESCARL